MPSMKRLRIPPGLQKMLEGLAKEALIEQPEDVVKFSYDYLSLQMKQRSNQVSHPSTNILPATKQEPELVAHEDPELEYTTSRETSKKLSEIPAAFPKNSLMEASGTETDIVVMPEKDVESLESNLVFAISQSAGVTGMSKSRVSCNIINKSSTHLKKVKTSAGHVEEASKQKIISSSGSELQSSVTCGSAAKTKDSSVGETTSASVIMESGADRKDYLVTKTNSLSLKKESMVAETAAILATIGSTASKKISGGATADSDVMEVGSFLRKADSKAARKQSTTVASEKSFTKYGLVNTSTVATDIKAIAGKRESISSKTESLGIKSESICSKESVQHKAESVSTPTASILSKAGSFEAKKNSDASKAKEFLEERAESVAARQAPVDADGETAVAKTESIASKKEAIAARYEESLAVKTNSFSTKIRSETHSVESISNGKAVADARMESVAAKVECLARKGNSLAAKKESLDRKTVSVAAIKDSLTGKTECTGTSLSSKSRSASAFSVSVASKTYSIAANKESRNQVANKKENILTNKTSHAQKIALPAADANALKTVSVAERKESLALKTESVSTRTKSTPSKTYYFSGIRESVVAKTGSIFAQKESLVKAKSTSTNAGIILLRTESQPRANSMSVQSSCSSGTPDSVDLINKSHVVETELKPERKDLEEAYSESSAGRQGIAGNKSSQRKSRLISKSDLLQNETPSYVHKTQSIAVTHSSTQRESQLAQYKGISYALKGDSETIRKIRLAGNEVSNIPSTTSTGGATPGSQDETDVKSSSSSKHGSVSKTRLSTVGIEEKFPSSAGALVHECHADETAYMTRVNAVPVLDGSSLEDNGTEGECTCACRLADVLEDDCGHLPKYDLLDAGKVFQVDHPTEDSHLAVDAYVTEDAHDIKAVLKVLDSKLLDDTHVFEDANVTDDAHVWEGTHVIDDVHVTDDADIFEDTHVVHNADVAKDADALEGTHVFEDSQTCDDPYDVEHGNVTQGSHVSTGSHNVHHTHEIADGHLNDDPQVTEDAHVTENVIEDLHMIRNGYMTQDNRTLEDAPTTEEANELEDSNLPEGFQVEENTLSLEDTHAFEFARNIDDHFLMQDPRATAGAMVTESVLRTERVNAMTDDDMSEGGHELEDALNIAHENCNVEEDLHDTEFVHELEDPSADVHEMEDAHVAEDLHFMEDAYEPDDKVEEGALVKEDAHEMKDAHTTLGDHATNDVLEGEYSLPFRDYGRTFTGRESRHDHHHSDHADQDYEAGWRKDQLLACAELSGYSPVCVQDVNDTLGADHVNESEQPLEETDDFVDEADPATVSDVTNSRSHVVTECALTK